MTLVLSVVVPTLDEAKRLPLLLEDLTQLQTPYEVIVVDGGSTDETHQVAKVSPARWVRSERGRSKQLNLGALEARAGWLMFLHADSRLPLATCTALDTWLKGRDPTVAGYFRFGFSTSGFTWRVIQWGQRVREKLFGLVYGDQGLVVSKALFEQVGGYPDIPIMEDVAMIDHVRTHGLLARIDGVLLTSPRRYQRSGPLREWIRNFQLIAAYRLGVPPQRLKRPVHVPRAARNHKVILFAKAPRPGYVKTRLAASIGEARATEIYAEMGRTVREQLREGSFDLQVSFAPHEAGVEVEIGRWLDVPVEQCFPQGPGDLGSRMHQAIQEALMESDKVCVVGADAPHLSLALVEQAFKRLNDHDVVLGPAEDGGYYLIGMTAPHPSLFEGIPWSTDQVLSRTLANAKSADLGWFLLRTLSDVDTVEDLNRVGILLDPS